MGSIENGLNPFYTQKIQDWLSQSWIYKEQHAQYGEALATVIDLLWPVQGNFAEIKNKPSYFPLPSLCAHALGRYSDTTTAVNSAWVLLYLASYLMDKIEDQETYHLIFSKFSYGAVGSLATGLYFHAQRILTELEPGEMIDDTTLNALRREFNRKALEVCAGQHMDLTVKEPSFQQVWEIVDAKSGRFFALGAYLGARLSTENTEIIEAFSHAGRCLGILNQIGNDLLGLGTNSATGSDLTLGKRTLPIQFALHVLPADQRSELVKLLNAAPTDPSAEIEARKMIISAGAVVYLTLEAEKQRRKAEEMLNPLNLDAELLTPLHELLHYAGRKK